MLEKMKELRALKKIEEDEGRNMIVVILVPRL